MRQLAIGLQMKTKTQVFRLLRTRSFFGIASSIESFSNEGKELFIQQHETSYATHTGQFDQIVGMLEQMLSRIQSDL